MKPYIVERQSFDATRPYAVIRTFRSFNKVAGRYSDERQAKARASALTRRHFEYLNLRNMAAV